MFREIESKIKAARKALKSIGYVAEEVSAEEFYDFMIGETFSGDITTLNDVLGNDYLMIHEVVEISELKKMGKRIDKRVIVNSPKTVIYDAHFTALEKELSCALHRKDYSWIRTRLRQYKESVLNGDPNLPEEMRFRAESIFNKFRKLIQRKKEA